MASVTEKNISDQVDIIRPSEEFRDEVDISFSFKNNTLIIFEKRPYFLDRSRIIEGPFFKARFIKAQKKWKIYWMRGNLKWVLYEPFPEADDIDTLFKILRDDKHGCFFG